MGDVLKGMVKKSYPASGYAMREIEWLMATYHVSLHDAVWRFPRVVILMLIPAYAERQGQSAGMTRPDRASQHARKKMRSMLEREFDVVDKPISEVGWQIGEPPQFIKQRYL